MVTIDSEFVQQTCGSTKSLKQRIHDLKEAEFVLGGLLSDIQRGYRFDDQLGNAKLKTLAQVATGLKEELVVLKSIYEKLCD